jgi:hypothetical protein
LSNTSGSLSTSEETTRGPTTNVSTTSSPVTTGTTGVGSIPGVQPVSIDFLVSQQVDLTALPGVPCCDLINQECTRKLTEWLRDRLKPKLNDVIFNIGNCSSCPICDIVYGVSYNGYGIQDNASIAKYIADRTNADVSNIRVNQRNRK